MESSPSPRRTRWIVLAHVKRGWFVHELGSGSPNGILAYWKGRTHVFQRWQFRTEQQFKRECFRRLAMAGLQLIGFGADRACRTGGGWFEVPVLVRRMASGTRSE